jgi:thioredoxin reductase (NADPH)
VIGGGNSALEESLFLATIADKVTILTRGELRASDLVQDSVRSNPRVEIHTGTDIVDFERRDGRLSAVLTRGQATGQERRFEPEAAFVFVGLDPNTQFLQGIVDRDEGGFIVTRDGYATSIDGVFAAGDVRSGWAARPARGSRPCCRCGGLEQRHQGPARGRRDPAA